MEPHSEPFHLRYMRPVAVGILAISLLLCGCTNSPTLGDDPSRAQTGATAGSGSTSADGGNGGSSLPAPALDAKWHGTMTVTPATAAPGQRVAMRFGSQEVRGIAFSLSAWGDEGWTVAYYLTSDWGSPGSHSVDWWSVEDSEGRGWTDVGVGGPGPDHVMVPESTPAGEYLLCTANSADEACAILTVTG